jgi:8-oxo-dGTP diphosphatase
MVQVVAAIIEHEGRILIGQRQPAQSHPLKWEFPGGKVEPGESAEQAVKRELMEELDLEVVSAVEIARYPYTYPGKNAIELIFFRITERNGEPRNLIFHDMRWVPQAALAAFDFVEGDTEFIRSLAA